MNYNSTHANRCVTRVGRLTGLAGPLPHPPLLPPASWASARGWNGTGVTHPLLFPRTRPYYVLARIR